MDMSGPILETKRLTLRRFREADIPDLIRLISAREVAATTLRIPYPYTHRDAVEFLTRYAQGPDLILAIVLRPQGYLCGGIGLHPESQHRRAELGYWIGLPYWGHGYATEAAQAVVRYGFMELKLNRIFASHFKENRASQRVLTKLGMRREGCMRQHVIKWGQFVDLELYSILREEMLVSCNR